MAPLLEARNVTKVFGGGFLSWSRTVARRTSPWPSAKEIKSLTEEDTNGDTAALSSWL